MPDDELAEPNSIEQDQGSNSPFLGFLAGFALIVAIGASALSVWTMNESQATVDALTVELEAMQESLNASTQEVNAAAVDRITDIDKAAAKATAEMNSTIDRALADAQALATSASSIDLAGIERDLSSANLAAQEAYGVAQDALDRTDDITACVNDYMDTIGRWSSNVNSYFTWLYC